MNEVRNGITAPVAQAAVRKGPLRKRFLEQIKNAGAIFLPADPNYYERQRAVIMERIRDLDLSPGESPGPVEPPKQLR